VKLRGSSLLLPLLALGLPVSSAVSAEATAEPDKPAEFSRVNGLFDVDLPKTVEKFKARVIVHPHFGDLLHRDYLRIPVGVRMGIAEHTEVSSELEGYVTHGLGGHSAGYGLDKVRLGLKHEFPRAAGSDLTTSAGVNTSTPVGRPPLEIVDGYNHVSPYVSFSKPWPGRPQLTPFATFGTDTIWKSSVPGSFDKNQPHSDSMGTSFGFLYDRGQFKYTTVFSYWTTAFIGRGHDNFTSINPSVLWQLPPALKFNAKGNWIFGIGFKANFGPDGTDVGVSAKLRGEFKLAHLFRRRQPQE
jgi:hypothetical protein